MTMGGVLLAEDDDDLRAKLAEVLRAEGHKVIPVRNGREALTAMANWQPALVLMDLVMPVMNGWQLLLELESTGMLNTTPVFILTAPSVSPVPPGHAVFVKPLNMDSLLRAVRVYAH